ncbi:MAG: AAA family ATPase [Bacteroidales bacterium]|nr:MAG: AAA family ATPase [Bacteroidales bacterium]
MIIKEIHIDGFGIFNNFSITSLKEGINIILGNNEAGKSTLLNFLRYTLFGYPKSVDQRMAPLNGGEHRGRIIALLSDKKHITFERTAGSSGGSIKLMYDGKSTEDQIIWSQLLGNATKEIFENVYAFSLDELTSWEKLSASGVEDKIFSVGLGLGNISISDVEGNIRKQTDEIYTQRGSKQVIPSIIKEINAKKTRILEIQDNLPRYQELKFYIKELEANINNIKVQLKKDESESDRLANYLKCYDSFIHIMNYDRELKSLPELHEYPGGGVEHLRDLEREELELNEKINGLINGIKEEKGIKELEEELDNASFNSAILGSEDKVEYLRTNLEKYTQAKRDRTDDDLRIEDLNKSIEHELFNISSGWTEEFVTDFSDMISHNDSITDFKRRFNELKDSKIKLVGQSNIIQTKVNPVNTTNLFVLISIIFFIGSLTALYYSLYVFSTSLLLIALLNFFGRKLLIKDKYSGNIEHQLSEVKAKEEKLKGAYESYLSSLNLDISLTTDSVLEIFRTIKEVKRLISDRNVLKRKQKEQRIPFINKFEQEIISLQNLADIKKPADNKEVFVNQLLNEFDTAKEQFDNREALLNKLNIRQKELESTEIRLKKVKSEITALFKSIKAKDREDFKKKYEENNKVKELIENRKNAAVNIETVIGLNKSDEVIKFLKTRNKEDIEKEKSELDEGIKTNSVELDSKNTELGEKKNEVRQIEGESELAEIMTGLESDRQKLHNAYKNWITGKIAINLLEDVKGKYEKEKQPEVIKNSNTYFKKITGERYKRIKVSMDEKEVSVFDAREASKKIEHLSRGTREQLLMSLRLGFIEEYERKAEPLPVIVDEVLVNFDPDRAKKTAGILEEFSKKRQILIFTCHPETSGYFHATGINKINIKEGR